MNDYTNQQYERPKCCEYRGLFFGPERDKRCAKHRTDAQNWQYHKAQEMGRYVLAKPDHWPYGANIDVHSRLQMLEWAARFRLRLYDGSHICLRWLNLGYCRKGWRCDGNLYHATGMPSHWVDHVTAWKTRDGKPAVIVSQPYYPTAEDKMDVRAICAVRELVPVITDDSWYGYSTTQIELWNSEAAKARNLDR